VIMGTNWGVTTTFAIKPWCRESKIKCCMPLHISYQGVSKYVTNGSITAVMDVIDFLCVSLRSSTIQLHELLGRRRSCVCSEAGFSSQNGDCVSDVYYRRAAFCFAFFAAVKTQCKRHS
jgi:hypothetical protein